MPVTSCPVNSRCRLPRFNAVASFIYYENAYPDDPVCSGSGCVGQPALLFATPLIDPRADNILKMSLIGRGHHSGQDGEIYKDLSGMRDLVERALVFIEQTSLSLGLVPTVLQAFRSLFGLILTLCDAL
jgi:hypothetical protein